MTDILIGAVITIISIAFGYNLGKNQSITPPDLKKKIDQVFNRVVPGNEVGAIERPTQRQIDLRNNPQMAEEQEVMNKTFSEFIE